MNKREIEKLARWGCELNCWKWPEDLPGKPKRFDEMKAFYHYVLERDLNGYHIAKDDIIRPMRELILSIIGEKEGMRYWHLHHCQRTNEEFEIWWTEREKTK